jgi:very-short-patch-repair endonuclease
VVDERVLYGNKDQPPGWGRAIAAIAEEQHGVVTSQQLGALGLGRKAIRGRVAAGTLYRVHRGVYAVGHRLVSRRGHYLAAALACGPGAALSHRSAGHQLGLRRSDGPIEVTVARSRGEHPGIVIHHSRTTTPEEVTLADRIPVTTVARTLLDLAAVLTPRQLGYAVDRAERLQVFDLAAVEDVLDRARGKRGAKALRKAVANWRPADVRSELEALFQGLIRDATLTTPDFNVLVDGERYTHEVDAFWPSHGLIVQLDGFAYHRTRRDRDKDATSDADLELAGYRVLRLTWDDVTVHKERTLRRLRRLLAGV